MFIEVSLLVMCATAIYVVVLLCQCLLLRIFSNSSTRYNCPGSHSVHQRNDRQMHNAGNGHVIGTIAKMFNSLEYERKEHLSVRLTFCSQL
jgi:hypothetical protein